MIDCVDASTQTQFRERRNVVYSLLLFPMFIVFSTLSLVYKAMIRKYVGNRCESPLVLEDNGAPKINLYRCKRHSICEPDSMYSSKESINTLSPPNGLRVARRQSVSRRRDSSRRSSVHSSNRHHAKYISQDNPIWRTMLLPVSLVLWLVDGLYNSAMMPVRMVARLFAIAQGRQAESGGDRLENYDDITAALSMTPAMLRRASVARIVPPPAYMLS